MREGSNSLTLLGILIVAFKNRQMTNIWFSTWIASLKLLLAGRTEMMKMLVTPQFLMNMALLFKLWSQHIRTTTKAG